jgi:hypothetical protein
MLLLPPLLLLAQVGVLLKAGAKPAAMAQQMAKVAFDNSLDKQRITPYSRAATEAFDMVSRRSRSSSSSSRQQASDDCVCHHRQAWKTWCV